MGVCGLFNFYRNGIESFIDECVVFATVQKGKALLKRVQRAAKLIERLGDC